jgi:alpha-tubulin suppressor-like RCC1 family protein
MVIQDAKTRSHTLGIKYNGTLWSWGNNESGALGQGDIISRSSPTQIGTSDNWKWVGTGGKQSYAIDLNNRLWVWGEQNYGELGLDVEGYTNIEDVSSPVQLGNNQWAKVEGSGYGYSTIGLRLDGTLWGWGFNSTKILGIGDQQSRSSPVQIGSDIWRDFEVGWGSVVAIRVDGTLWAWGRNINGECGFADTLGSVSPVQIGTDTTWHRISMNSNHSLAIKLDGTLWATGANGQGQLGVGDRTSRSSFIQIGSDTDWKLVQAGYYTSIAMKTDGTIWTWGGNDGGALGYGVGGLTVGVSTFTSSPVQVGGDVSWKSVDLSGAGVVYSQKYIETGGLFTAGENDNGELGLGDRAWRSSPTQVGTNTSWIDIAQGTHGLAIKNNYALFAWGKNDYGELGQGDQGVGTDRSSPVQVGSDLVWSKCCVTSSNGTSVAIRTNGSLWMWGNNSNALIQTGGSNHESSPVQKGSATDWAEVKGGYDHMGGLKTDGSLWLWGNSGQGALGNSIYGGTYSDPLDTFTGETWIDFTCGYGCTLAIKTDGTLWAWGRNDFGQHGNETTSTTNSPVQVGSDTDWLKVSCQGQTVLALKEDGSLFVWGRNDYGNHGGWWSDHRSSPVQLGSDLWSRVFNSYNTSYAIKKDGTLWAWGLGTYGQLAQGDTSNVSSPVQVGSEQFYKVATDFDALSITGIASFLRKVPPLGDSGTLYFTGENAFGISGNGASFADYQYYSYPTQVGLGDTPWSDAIAGEGIAIGVKEDKSLWMWGRGTNGALDNDTSGTVTTSFPTQIGTDNVWIKCAMSGENSGPIYALKDNGTLWAWGNGQGGELGQGSDLDPKSSPVQVGTEEDWISLEASEQTVIAVREGGDLYGWGDDTVGQLGQGNSGVANNVSSPVQIGASGEWSEATKGGNAVGANFTIALKKDGTLWGSGRNDNGQLGDGTTESRSTPVQVGTDSDWVFVACGDTFAHGIKSDGTLWGWGRNNLSNGLYGKLGLGGDFDDRSSPTQVGTDTDWVYVACGNINGYAVKSDGTIYGWGANTKGQLGVGSQIYKSSPTQMITTLSAIQVRVCSNGLASGVMIIGA